MSATSQRDSIPHVAEKDWKKARSIASDINEPWFRCQALAKVVNFAPDKKTRLRLIDLALSAAFECDSPNRRVTVSAWPVKVMANLGYTDQVNKTVRKLLNEIDAEDSPVRKADALNVLLGAVSELQSDVFWEVYDSFLSACTFPLASGKRNSKGEGLLAQWAGHVVDRCEKRGRTLVESITGPKHREQAETLIRMNRKAITWPNL